MEGIKDIDGVRAWLDGSGASQADLARAAGISPGTVNQVLRGAYPSDPAPHVAAMAAAAERLRSRAAARSDIPFVETSVARGVAAVARRAHHDRDFGLYVGRVGIGKTVALKRYCDGHRGQAVLVEAYPGATAPVLLRLLAERLGVAVRRRTVADLTAACSDALAGGDVVVLVDEAETLAHQALLHLRRISDNSGTGVVLAGTPPLLSLVRDPDGRFGQITSRIGMWPPVAQAITEADAGLLAESFLGRRPAPAVLQALWTACGGSARALRNVMRNSVRFCAAQRIDLDAGVVERIDRQATGGRSLAA